MKKFILVTVLGLVLVTGCDFNAGLSLFDKQAKKSPAIVEQSERVIVALEDATGKTIPVEISSKGEVISGKVADVAGKGQAAVATLKAFMPMASPYADVAYTILGAVGTLAGAAGTFFSRRKAKANEQEAKTLIKAVDDVAGIGKKINDIAELTGTAAGIKQKYIEVKTGA